jgi:hypothetical protein
MSGEYCRSGRMLAGELRAWHRDVPCQNYNGDPIFLRAAPALFAHSRGEWEARYLCGMMLPAF